MIPFYFSAGVDLLALRAFRLLKLVRYSQAFTVFAQAMKVAKGQLIAFGFTTLILDFYLIRRHLRSEHGAQPEQFVSVFESLWWVIENLLRINMGHRDIQPVTVAERSSPTS